MSLSQDNIDKIERYTPEERLRYLVKEVVSQSWATGEWQDCEPKAISLEKWYASWTQGLEEDDVFIAVFPNQDEEGLIISPQELDYELKQQAKK